MSIEDYFENDIQMDSSINQAKKRDKQILLVKRILNEKEFKNIDLNGILV